jgi:hypothetical protein
MSSAPASFAAASEQRAHKPSPTGTLLRFVSLLLLLAYCVGGAALVTIESVRMIPTQEEITYPEGATTYLAILAGRTGQLYYSYSSPPPTWSRRLGRFFMP